jgi:phenylacetate-CoA ligase
MTDLYGFLFQRVLYPGLQSGLKRRPTLLHLRELERTQWCSLDELQALQQRELRHLLTHAFDNIPYARERYRRAGLGPGDVQHLDDLTKLPLLTRDEASEHATTRRSVAPPLASIDKSTSGTTGRPLAFAYDRGSEYWRQATKLRGYGWAGYQLGDPSIHYWGSPSLKPPPFARKLKESVDHSFRREHYVDCTERSERALDRVVERIRGLRPKVIVCYSQAGAALARHVNAKGLRDWSDINVICAAERLFPSDRSAMSQAFGPGVFETYGNREVMLIAAECEAHQGLHQSMENLIVEVVVRNGDTQRPAEPGELGEVAITDLHNYGAPFVRYLTGDLAVARPNARCACGRWLSRLERIEGRATETLRDGQGNPVSGMFFSVLFAYLADKVREFQVIQRRDNAIDLRLVPAGTLDDSLLEAIKAHIGKYVPGVPLRPQVVSELLPDRSGKRRVVVVEKD